MKEYVHITIRKIYDKQFSSDVMANRLIGTVVCLLCLCYYFTVGFFIDDFIINIEADLTEASFFVVSLGLWADLILKLALWNGHVDRLQKLEVLPIAKKCVVFVRFVESLSNPYNFGLFIYIMPFSVSLAAYDAVSASVLPCAMLLAGICNAAFSNVVKISMDCRPAKSTISTLLIIVCAWLIVSCMYKINAECTILPIQNLHCTLPTVVMLFLTIAVLFVAWRIYLSLNIRFELRSNNVFSLIGNRNPGNSYSVVFAQVSRSAIRKNYLSFIFISLVIPVLASSSVNETVIYTCIVMPFLLPLSEADQTFSVESTYMDRLATLSPMLLYNILVTKYRMCIIWEAVMLGLMLVLLPSQYMFFLLSVCLYSSGSLLLVEFGSVIFNAKRWNIMENPKVSLFGPYNIITIAVCLFSILFYLMIVKIWSINVANAVFISFGISGILLHTVVLNFIYKKFMERRHLNLLKYRMFYL